VLTPPLLTASTTSAEAPAALANWVGV